jgi:hypothetical protein
VSPARIEPLAATGAPRALTHTVFVAYAETDQDLFRNAERAFNGLNHTIRTIPDVLLSRTESHFRTLEEHATRCHSGLLLLSRNSLPQMLHDQSATIRLLQVIRDRTGGLAILWQGDDWPGIPERWPIDLVIQTGEIDVAVGLSAQVVNAADNYIKKYRLPSSPRAVGLPFVIMAMTSSEAEELHRTPQRLNEAFGGESFRQFMALLDSLKAAHVEFPSGRYSDARAGWRPFSANPQTVWEAIEEVVRRLNETGHPQNRQLRIKPQYYPIDMLMSLENEGVLGSIYGDVARSGCVVVADELSLFHWDLRSAFIQSHFFNSEQTALVTISPFDAFGDELRSAIEDEFRRTLRLAFRRFETTYDSRFEFGIHDRRHLMRWLHNSLPQSVAELREPFPDYEKIRRFYTEAQVPEITADLAQRLYSR